jgi:ech hydrogenase subunit E
MANRTVVPFGPQHPALPEPIHLDLVLEDEKVVEAIPSIGFIHRGLEKLVEKRDFVDYVYVAERICGICSFMHGMGYCMAVENTMGIVVPTRADYLRTTLAELARIHNHTMWMGLLADAFGFESLFMHSWRVREIVLDVFENITGGRVIFSVCKIGGMRRDIDAAQADLLLTAMDRVEKELEPLISAFTQEYTVLHRLTGVGVLGKQQALDLGALGPMLRASGWSLDTRLLGYAAYDDLEFEPVVETAGDCLARTKVRIRETLQSIDLIRQAVPKFPAGEIAAPVKGNPNGEFFARVEQPRGEAIYYVRGNGTRHLERFRVRTPTFANVPALVQTLQGCQLADVPMLVLTIDPCISCTER